MTAANASCDDHSFSRGEPALEEILAGPIVRAVMLADHVDAEALTAMLRSVGLRLRERTRAPRPARRPSAHAGEQAFSAVRPEPTTPVGVEISAVRRLGAEG
jgi:hypothetical protein